MTLKVRYADFTTITRSTSDEQLTSDEATIVQRAVALLDVGYEYVLTDGFPVDGLGVPGLAVWKGDRVAACIAAASVVAKVTRDRIMIELDEKYPGYGFAEHKGYSTDEHSAALARHGPCPEHRYSYVNVAAVAPVEAVGSAQRRRRSTVSVAADGTLALRLRTSTGGVSG